MTEAVVSIIVTTKNEQDVIGRLLNSIKNQKNTSFEIIVVDNNSTDGTREVAKKYTKRVYNHGPERSSQRNFGAKKAIGKYLFFIDADMELTETIVASCVSAIKKNKRIGGVIVPELSIARSFWEKVKAHERSFYNKSGDTLTDAARFFTKEAFNAVGGYDETITGPEDWDLPENITKKGYTLVRVTPVIYHYERISSPWKLAQKKYYYALTSHRYLKKHNISLVSAKTIYFLRPVFYQNWRHLLSHPVLSVAMFAMFTMELVGGGLGFVVGKLQKL